MPNKLLATTIILSTIIALVIGMKAVEVVHANPILLVPLVFLIQLSQYSLR